MDFCSDYDRALAEHGPPTLFLRTIEHKWRCMPDLTRDGWERNPDMERDPAHVLLRDTATGYVTRAYVTGRALLLNHPRATATYYDDEASADSAYKELGRPPVT